MCKHVKNACRQTYICKSISDNHINTFLFFIQKKDKIKGNFQLGTIKFVTRHADWPAVEEIVLNGEYDFIKPWLQTKSTPVIVDLGANIGLFSMLVFNVCPSALVYSLEPAQTTYELLSYNRKINLGFNWNILNIAIWEKDSQVGFFYNPVASTSSFVDETMKNYCVKGISLETLLKQIGKPVDLLKIDIEGAEEKVLNGSRNILSQIGSIIMEIHPYRCNQEHVINLLKDIYLNIYKIGGRKSRKLLLLASHEKWELEPYS